MHEIEKSSTYYDIMHLRRLACLKLRTNSRPSFDSHLSLTNQQRMPLARVGVC